MLRKMLADAGYGSSSELARMVGILPCSVSQAANGRDAPASALLAALGLRRVMLYEVIGEPVTIQPRPVRVKEADRGKTPHQREK